MSDFDPLNYTRGFGDGNNATAAGVLDVSKIPSLASRFLFSYESVNKLYTPILFLFGTVGNCLSVTVFCIAPSHRHLSSSYYLSALAISDTGFLINLLAVWLEDLGFGVITSQLTCPLVMYLGQVTCFLSVWLTVSFTVERFFAVCYPLTRPTVCTVARAKKVITVLTLVALVAFSYVWYIARALDFPLNSPPLENMDGNNQELSERRQNEGSIDRDLLVNSSLSGCKSLLEMHLTDGEKIETHTRSDFIQCNGSDAVTNSTMGGGAGGETIRVCSVRPEHIYFSSYASHTDSLLTLILPFLIITYLNVRIALCVWKLKDQRQNIMAIAKISSNHSNNQQVKSDHLSLACRVPPSRSSALLNGIQSPSSSSLSNCKTYRINLGSTTSLNTANTSSNVNGSNLSRLNRNHSSSTSASEARVTKTLLLVSTVFLVLNLPAHTIRAVAYIQSLWNLQMQEELQAAQQWANILFNTNFSVNFLLYCVSGRNFRKSLWNIFFSTKSGRPAKHGKRSGLGTSTKMCSTHQRPHKAGVIISAPSQERDLCMNNTLDIGTSLQEIH